MADEARRPSWSNVRSPLGVVGLFLVVVEAGLGYGLGSTSGKLQVAVFVFMAIFATCVMAGFFYILWHRNWVFYPPSDFSDASVHGYVAAMSSGRRTELAGLLKANVSRVFDEVIRGREQAGSLPDTAEDMQEVLQELRKDTIAQIEGSVLRFDATRLKDDSASRWEEVYDSNMSVRSLLDGILWQLQPFPPYPYGGFWVLKDASSGKIYDDIGPMWARRHDVADDNRSLQEVGITGGMTLEVIPPSVT